MPRFVVVEGRREDALRCRSAAVEEVAQDEDEDRRMLRCWVGGFGLDLVSLLFFFSFRFRRRYVAIRGIEGCATM